MLFTIIIFIAVLAVLVLVHELGHFFTALKFGCKVDEFGFGFPPRIKAWKSKKTGIEYSINAIPLGGFVKIKGEDGDNRQEADSFGSKKAWQRAIILASGVAMNIVLAVVLLSIGFGFGLPTALPENLADLGPSARVSAEQTQIYMVSPSSPAEKAGLQAGDAILQIDGQSFNSLTEIQNYIDSKKDQSIVLDLKRSGEEVKVTVKPEFIAEINRAGIGVGLMRTAMVSYPWYLAIVKGVEATWNLGVTIVLAFYNILKNLFMGHPVGADISGPIGIAVLTGQVARMGWIYILQFVALLSLNLAIINFLPFPALDGGRILFLIIEKIRHKPINQTIENIVHNIGFALLMLLMVFVTYRDVVKWGGGLWQKIFG